MTKVRKVRMNSFTQNLFETIGSPFASCNSELDVNDLIESYRYAALNRIPFLFLSNLNKRRGLGNLQTEYGLLSRRYSNIQKAFIKLSRFLDRASIQYAFFKSLRPYQEVTVDIDVIVFDPFFKASRAMRSAGYKLLGIGPLSATFRDSEANINIDLYEEVGASHIIYLDKEKLRDFTENRPAPNGLVFHSLCPEADLLSVIAHSVIKEQMYVLSEYFTTLYYLAGMSRESLGLFLSLVDECKLRSVAKVHLGITALLHSEFHNVLPKPLGSIISSLGRSELELSLVANAGFKMPHKYHLATVVKALIGKFGEEKARRSFGSQLMSMLSPDSGLSVLRDVFFHAQRETY